MGLEARHRQRPRKKKNWSNENENWNLRRIVNSFTAADYVCKSPFCIVVTTDKKMCIVVWVRHFTFCNWNWFTFASVRHQMEKLIFTNCKPDWKYLGWNAVMLLSFVASSNLSGVAAISWKKSFEWILGNFAHFHQKHTTVQCYISYVLRVKAIGKLQVIEFGIQWETKTSIFHVRVLFLSRIFGHFVVNSLYPGVSAKVSWNYSNANVDLWP